MKREVSWDGAEPTEALSGQPWDPTLYCSNKISGSGLYGVYTYD